MSLTAWAADEEKSFKANRAVTYAAKSSQGKVTVAVVPYHREEDVRVAFGKANLLEFGILPVLVVIDNDSDQALRLNLKAQYVEGRSRVAATPAEDVPYLNAPSRPRPLDQPARYPIPLPKKKNKLAAWEIDGRAFRAKMVPPGESVSGFFYFRTPYDARGSIYLTGLSEAASGKELFYFDLPFETEK
jgi:hypothetical protein